jgi:hypothetical protein
MPESPGDSSYRSEDVLTVRVGLPIEGSWPSDTMSDQSPEKLALQEGMAGNAVIAGRLVHVEVRPSLPEVAGGDVDLLARDPAEAWSKHLREAADEIEVDRNDMQMCVIDSAPHLLASLDWTMFKCRDGPKLPDDDTTHGVAQTSQLFESIWRKGPETDCVILRDNQYPARDNRSH